MGDTTVLAPAMGRQLRFHPQGTTGPWIEDWCKWVIDRTAGGAGPLPLRREPVPRGLKVHFDCPDARCDPEWVPAANRAGSARHPVAIRGQ